MVKKLENFLKSKIHAVEVGSDKCAIAFPMYKIDGGMYEIFLVTTDSGYILSDEGATLTELDRIFELSEADVIKNLIAILKQYGCKKIGGSITIECSPDDIHIKLGYLVQAISFMLNMKIFYV